MNNTLSEMNTTLKGINSRITEAEEHITKLEDRVVEITATEKNKEKRMKRIEDNFREFWDIKHTNIHITGSPEGEKRERKGQEKYLKRQSESSH